LAEIGWSHSKKDRGPSKKRNVQGTSQKSPEKNESEEKRICGEKKEVMSTRPQDKKNRTVGGERKRAGSAKVRLVWP